MERRTEMSRATPHWSEQDLEAAKQRMMVRGGAHEHRRSSVAVREPVTRTPNAQETGRSPVSNPAPSPYKSKLEALYARELAALAHAGEIISWQYEPLNFRLPGQKNFYKPDFLVRDGDGLTFYEVKGRNLSDDRSLVKMKTAAGLNTWARFVLVKRIKGQWEARHVA